MKNLKRGFAFCLFAIATQAHGQFSKATIYTTAKNNPTEPFRQVGERTFVALPQPLETQPCIFVDPKKSFQTFLGVGGAITDATAETFAKLQPPVQQAFLKAYFDEKTGLGYQVLRTNMNSCDFSSASYTYVQDGDADLHSFNISHDEQFKIPLIKKAFALNSKLKFFISPWSPPAWMKTNNDMLHGGSLLPQYMQSWANYYIRFIQAYEAQGMPVWGLTVQNEPLAKQRWESCIYTAENERDFVKNFLGPTLEKNKMSEKKLIVWDHNRDLIFQRADVILSDADAARYVWGVGFHWYETWTGSAMQFDNLKQVKTSFPDKELIFTEGCVEKFDLKRIDDWSLGERYGHSMINDFNSGTVAWTDWNMLLDDKGGPNHVGNFCFAPIHADTQKGKLLFTNSYYYIGHISKFVKPGAKRIATASSRDLLEATAFENPDKSIAVVVMNSSEKPLVFKVWIAGKSVDVQGDAHSISTIVIQ